MKIEIKAGLQKSMVGIYESIDNKDGNGAPITHYKGVDIDDVRKENSTLNIGRFTSKSVDQTERLVSYLLKVNNSNKVLDLSLLNVSEVIIENALTYVEELNVYWNSELTYESLPLDKLPNLKRLNIRAIGNELDVQAMYELKQVYDVIF